MHNCKPFILEAWLKKLYPWIVLYYSTVPLAPTSVASSVVSGDPSSLYVSWNPPVYPNGRITHFNVYCQEYQFDAGSGSGMFVLPTPTYQPIFSRTVLGYDMNATITGFTPFTSYGCHVSANTSVGEGIISNTVIQTTDEYGTLQTLRVNWYSIHSQLVSTLYIKDQQCSN